MSQYINDIYTAPAYHWLMFIKYNNLSFFKVDSLNLPPKKVSKDIDSNNTRELMNAYHEINDQIIEEFGVNESFEARLSLKKDIAFLKLDFIIDEKRSKRTEFRIKELELSTPQQENDNQMALSKEILLVSKNLGIGIIDIKGYSIFQYLTAKNG